MSGKAIDIEQFKEPSESTIAEKKVSQQVKAAIAAIACLFSLFYIYTARFGVISPQVSRGIYVGGSFFLVFLVFPADKKNKRIAWYDYVCSVLALASVVYFIVKFPEMAYRAGIATGSDIFFGLIAIALSLEATRRVTGDTLALITAVFLGYIFAGPFFPGILAHRGVSISRAVSFLYSSLYGIFGGVAQTFATYVFLFIIFGVFMEKSGAGEFFIDLALCFTGRTRGGPAKAAVVSSGLMGTISGSAVANVVTTGTFTIPLMKKIGYPPHIAAAVETVASSGGAIVPPIMGAGAFIMSEFTGIPYWDIAKASIFPAFLFYLSLFSMIDLEAAKLGLKALPASELPSPNKILREGWQYFLPLVVIVFLLLRGNTPALAAFWAIVAVVAASWVKKEKRMGIKEIYNALSASAIQSLTVGATVGSIGIITGAFFLTGLGVKFPSLMLSVSGGNVFFAILFVALAAYILGLAVTVTSTYIILAVLAAPALHELGLSLLASHLIIFWFCQDANVTPPVCLPAFAAAGIADADPMQTGYHALKFSKSFYIIPVLFAFTPLLLEGTTTDIILNFVTCSAGMLLASVALQGYLTRPLGIGERIFLAMAAITLFFPIWTLNLGTLLVVAAYIKLSHTFGGRVIADAAAAKDRIA